MKKSYFKLVSVFFFLFFVQGILFSEKENIWQSFPPKTEYLAQAGIEKESVLAPDLMILGWGKNEYLAYFQTYFIDGAGFYIFEWKIDNIKTQKTVWSLKDQYDGEDQLEGKNPAEPDFLKIYYSLKIKTVSKVLAKYKINPQSQTDLLKPDSFQVSQNNFSVKTLVKMIYIKDFEWEQVKSYQITLNKGKLKKVILSKKSHQDEGLLDFKTAGVFISPDQKYSAFLTLRMTRGYEGPPHDLSLNMVYTSLEKGFKK
ncbi:MAG TPA: hypothetical protein DHW82_06565 [Spirochaetia bacterium]|nr:MAG: hypothetical protein A2Y41_08660 [Spirochaetes bacterium GWB1_36_13]HCL56656.1 hypothetical protein [Spirochaetia bacterium]